MAETDPSEPEPFTDGVRPRWWPRVHQSLIRRLYENDAQGIVDEELIADVGTQLHLRCESILIATEAHDGRARCARCDRIIVRTGARNERMICPGCGWQATWAAYHKTYQDKQLHGGGAMHAFRAYVERFPNARTPRVQLLLIDRLIHAFHCELMAHPTRPAACNLIGGKITDVALFLDNLTYGERNTPGVREEFQAWTGKVDRAIDSFRALVEEKSPRRRQPRTGD